MDNTLKYLLENAMYGTDDALSPKYRKQYLDNIDKYVVYHRMLSSLAVAIVQDNHAWYKDFDPTANLDKVPKFNVDIEYWGEKDPSDELRLWDFSKSFETKNDAIRYCDSLKVPASKIGSSNEDMYAKYGKSQSSVNFSERIKKCFSSELPRSRKSPYYKKLVEFLKSKKFNKLDQQLVDLLMDWDIDINQVIECAKHLREVFPKAEIIDDKYIKYIIDNKAVDKYSYDHGPSLPYNIQIDGLSEFTKSGGTDAHKFEGYYIQAKDLDEATKIYNDVNLSNFIKLSKEFWSSQK